MKENEFASGKMLRHKRRLKVLDLASAGLTRKEIAKECSCSINSVSRVIVAAGGRPSRRSRRRSRSPRQLSLLDREEIRVAVSQGKSEGDLILGKNGKSFIGTLVERQTRFVMLLDLQGDRRAENLAEVMARQITTLPKKFRKTLTWDQGKATWPCTARSSSTRSRPSSTEGRGKPSASSPRPRR